MTPHDPTTTAIAHHVIGVLGDAVASIGGDDAAAERVGPHLDTIATDAGPAALYGAMGGWIAGARAIVGETGGVWSVVAINPATGAETPIDDAHPAGRAAARLLAAELNGDHDTSHALFTAALEAGDAEAVVLRVLHSCALAIHHHKGANS